MCSFLVGQLTGSAYDSEHLLFMGTKTFPSENEYSAYLSKNNGHSNAWTAMTSTTYFFDVGADALEGALDRFSGFFYEPLFNEVSQVMSELTTGLYRTRDQSC